MVIMNETGKLSNDTIAKWVDEAVEAYGKAAGKRADFETGVQLSVEEMLLRIRDLYGEEKQCRIIGRNSHGNIRFEFRYRGEQKDPFEIPEDELLAYDLLAKLEINPRYKHSERQDMNTIIMPMKTKPIKNRMLILMLLALVCAIAVRFAIGGISEDAVQYLYENLTQPIFKKMIACITTLATPLVFIAVVTGITGLGDAASFGKIGSKVIKGMGLTYLIAALLFVIAAFAYPPASAANAEEGSVLGQIIQLVLDIIPDNLLQPFTIDNDLQVITIAIFVGVIMLMLGNEMSKINALLEECSKLVNKMMAVFCNLLPLIVFLGIYNLLCTCDPKQFVSMGKAFLLFIVMCSVLMAVTILRTCIMTRVPFGILFKKMMPTLMINLATSSQVAAIPENMKCCKEKFGIDSKLVDFALPLAIVVFMPCGAIFIGVSGAFLADFSGTGLPVDAFIKLVVVSVILAIAAPPIPGSAFAVLPILFTACGIPQEVYPLAVVLGTILGYVLPALNGMLLQMQILITAWKMDLLDKDALRAEWKE